MHEFFTNDQGQITSQPVSWCVHCSSLPDHCPQCAVVIQTHGDVI